MSYVGYFEVNKEYIIEKYCVNKSAPKLKCNGKCHLSKKLTSITTSKSKENQFKAMLSSFKNIFTPLYFSNEKLDINELVLITSKRKSDSLLVIEDYLFYLSISSPPPRA